MAALIDLDGIPQIWGSSFGRGGDEKPLAPFSRGKFVWTTGVERLLAETMIMAIILVYFRIEISEQNSGTQKL
jgi:hypothetical protein